MGKYLVVLKANWRTMYAYRTDLAMKLVTGMTVKIVVAFALWTVLFQSSGYVLIGGMTLAEFQFYYAMQALLGIAFSRTIIEQMSQDVLEGELVTTLSRPVRYPLYHLARFAAPTLIFLVSGSIIVSLTVLFFQLPFPLELGRWIFFGVSCALAYVLYFLLEFLIGSLTFYIGRVTEVRFIFRYTNALLSGALVPLTVLPMFLQGISSSLPFASIYYIPLMQLLGPYDILTSLSSVLLQLFWVGFIGLLALAAWMNGLRRYDAPGG